VFDSIRKWLSKGKDPTQPRSEPQPQREPEPEPEGDELAIPAHPEVGHIYAFRTRPFCTFSPQETGRYAAIKVLGVSDLLVVVAILDGIWQSRPSLAQAERAGLLTEHRFAHTGRLAVFGAYRKTWDIAEAFTEPRFLGHGRLTGEERARAASILRGDLGTSTAWLTFANHAPEGEWRWTHDREALLEEVTLRDAKSAREQAEKEARYNERLKGLTLETLLGETPFARWSPSPPFPPEDFTKDARAAIHAACRDIQALGDKPRKADVRKVLKRTMEWFNAADEAAGNVIETEEREDIMAVLEEIAHAAKHKALVPEIDDWRDW
jgi:hypothetical protein